MKRIAVFLCFAVLAFLQGFAAASNDLAATFESAVGTVGPADLNIRVRVTADGQAVVERPGTHVTAVLFRRGTRVCQFALNDSGRGGDQTAADGVWSKRVDVSVPAGEYEWGLKVETPGNLRLYRTGVASARVIDAASVRRTVPQVSPSAAPGSIQKGISVGWFVLACFSCLVAGAAMTYAIARQNGRGARADDLPDVWQVLYRNAGGLEDAYNAWREALDRGFLERTQMLKTLATLRQNGRDLIGLYEKAEANKSNMRGILFRLGRILDDIDGDEADSQ